MSALNRITNQSVHHIVVAADVGVVDILVRGVDAVVDAVVHIAVDAVVHVVADIVLHSAVHAVADSVVAADAEVHIVLVLAPALVAVAVADLPRVR